MFTKSLVLAVLVVLTLGASDNQKPVTDHGSCSGIITKPTTPCRENLVNAIEHVINFVRDFPTLCWGQACSPPGNSIPATPIVGVPEPIIEIPSTVAPTQPTTTLAPTTQAPTTQAPTTQAPTTKAPTTQAPTTKAPTTKGPTTTHAPDKPVVCNQDSDVAIILDSSGSIGWQSYIKAKEFVAELSRAFTKHAGNRFSLVYYSDVAVMHMNISNGLSPEAMATHIKNTPYLNSYTMTAAGIRMSKKDLFDHRRKNVQQSIIVLTDGASHDDADAAGKEARSVGIKTLAVGIGAGIQYKDLVDIAGNSTNVETVTSYNDLKKIMSAVSQSLCSSSAR